jgi:uncharacterized protein YcnI
MFSINYHVLIIKRIAAVLILVTAFYLLPSTTYGHVVVKPSEIGMGARTNFVVSVPTEEAVSTTQIRLIIPEGVESVRPNTKSGWTIQLIKEPVGMKGETLNTGEPAPERVKEIIWSGGNIPAEQRDEFIFSAMVPAEEKSLVWKAYQSYANGKIVAWDKDPATIKEHTDAGYHDVAAELKPYSKTQVINDLKISPAPQVQQMKTFNENWIAWLALFLAAISLGLQIRKRI